MTSNYNIIYTGKKTKYKQGDVFHYTGNDWRLEAFDGLKIESITFNFGDVLHFNMSQWNNRRNGLTPTQTTPLPSGEPSFYILEKDLEKIKPGTYTAKTVEGQLIITPPTTPLTSPPSPSNT
jgi:hypothetical protein